MLGFCRSYIRLYGGRGKGFRSERLSPKRVGKNIRNSVDLYMESTYPEKEGDIDDDNLRCTFQKKKAIK